MIFFVYGACFSDYIHEKCAYFGTPISTGFFKVVVSCWFFESCFASY